MKKESVDGILSLQRVDIDEAIRLSSQAGWNQTEADWARLIDLNPDTCFLFRKDSQMVGTATLATYGTDLGWIGMVIVDRSFRGQGIGKHLLETTISAGRNRGCRIIGLDATDQGRHLYNQYGFYDVHPIDRWVGSLQSKNPSDSVEILEGHHLTEAIKLDLRWSGVDRSKLIKRLFHESTVQKVGLIYNDQLLGTAFLRKGQQFHHLGPVLADTNKILAQLLNAVARILQGESVLVDVIRRRETTTLLKDHGLKIQRQLTRMTLDEPRQALNDSKLHAAVSFEWG